MGTENNNDDTVNVLKFIVKYWHFLTIIFGLIITLTYHVVELKMAHESIKKLTDTNANLVNQLKELDVKVKEVYDFIPPKYTYKRVNDLEFEVFKKTNDPITISGGSASYNPVK